MDDLKQKAVRGAFAKAWSQMILAVLRIGSLMVLARLLTPRDFGLVAMVTVVTGIFGLFLDAGLSLVTVQRPNISRDQVSTLFWANVLVGAILSLLTLIAAPIMVAFYHESRLLWIAIALSAGFLINATGVQHAALLQRQMRFTVLALIEILAYLSSSIIGIAMAIGGLGYWSLVAMAIVPTIVSTVGFWLASAWVPGRPRRHVGARSMLSFGGQVTLSGIIIYYSLNLDKVLLGRYWGTEALGIYGRAYQLISIPRDYVGSAVGNVAVASLSRLHAEPARFKSYFLKGYSLMLALLLPITFTTALFADEIILFFLGPTWKDAALILRLLTPTILVIGLFSPLRWFLYAMGRIGRSLKISLVLAPLVTAAYFIGLPHGPRGVALAFSSLMMIWIIPNIFWSIHGTMVSLRDVLRTTGRPIVSVLTATALAVGLKVLVGGSLSSFVRLVLGAAVLFAVHFGMLLFVMRQKDFYLGLLHSLRKKSPLPADPQV